MIALTCRDLIVHILTNSLEDEPVFKNGRFVGFMTADDAAVILGVGKATIYAMITMQQLDYIYVGDHVFIPKTTKLERKHSNEQ